MSSGDEAVAVRVRRTCGSDAEVMQRLRESYAEIMLR